MAKGRAELGHLLSNLCWALGTLMKSRRFPCRTTTDASRTGDKTFLIAAIMATRHPRITVFAGAFASLVIMSVLSAALGRFVLGLVPKVGCFRGWDSSCCSRAAVLLWSRTDSSITRRDHASGLSCHTLVQNVTGM